DRRSIARSRGRRSAWPGRAAAAAAAPAPAAVPVRPDAAAPGDAPAAGRGRAPTGTGSAPRPERVRQEAPRPARWRHAGPSLSGEALQRRARLGMVVRRGALVPRLGARGIGGDADPPLVKHAEIVHRDRL